MLAEAARLARERGAAHVELRHVDRQLPESPVRQHKVTMLLRLQETAEAQWTALDNKVRNMIRKAEKSELTSESGGSELLDAFYAVFSVNMRDLGTPVYPTRFFAAVLKACGPAARLHVVRHQGRPVAASMTIAHRNRVEVPWASALREARAMNPNMLLYWHMLREVIASGGRVFDFGRSTPGEGTFHFKKQWKAEPVPLHWEYALIARDAPPDQSPGSGKFAMAIELWKKLPVPDREHHRPADHREHTVEANGNRRTPNADVTPMAEPHRTPNAERRTPRTARTVPSPDIPNPEGPTAEGRQRSRLTKAVSEAARPP